MPPVITMQITEISGTFTSALNIAMELAVLWPFIFVLGIGGVFIKTRSFNQKKYATRASSGFRFAFAGVAFWLFLLAPFF